MKSQSEAFPSLAICKKNHMTLPELHLYDRLRFASLPIRSSTCHLDNLCPVKLQGASVLTSALVPVSCDNEDKKKSKPALTAYTLSDVHTV